MRKLIVLVLLALPVYAAISIDLITTSSLTNENTVSTPVTWSHTVGSGSTAMWVGISYQDYYGAQTVSSVTLSCGAQSFVKLDSSRDSGNRTAESWWLASPNAGSCTVTLTVSGAFGPSGYAWIKATAVTFRGSKTTTPIHGGGTTTGSGSLASQTYSLTVSAANAYLVGVLYTTSPSYSAENATGQTSIYHLQPESAGDAVGSYRAVGTGAQALGWTFSWGVGTRAAVVAFEEDTVVSTFTRRRVIE